MKNIYMIKETCPMWNDGTGVDYKVIKPYVFLKQKEAETCRLDFEWISADRVLCTEYELINIEVDNEEELKEINVEGELIIIRNVINGDYEEEFRYDIHSWEQLDSAGRIGNDYSDEEFETDGLCENIIYEALYDIEEE